MYNIKQPQKNNSQFLTRIFYHWIVVTVNLWTVKNVILNALLNDILNFVRFSCLCLWHRIALFSTQHFHIIKFTRMDWMKKPGLHFVDSMNFSIRQLSNYKCYNFLYCLLKWMAFWIVILHIDSWLFCYACKSLLIGMQQF